MHDCSSGRLGNVEGLSGSGLLKVAEDDVLHGYGDLEKAGKAFCAKTRVKFREGLKWYSESVAWCTSQKGGVFQSVFRHIFVWV